METALRWEWVHTEGRVSVWVRTVQEKPALSLRVTLGSVWGSQVVKVILEGR